MEHSPRAQELLTGLLAAFPGLRPLEEGDLPLVFAPVSYTHLTLPTKA